jgi:hypothetical protein
MATPLVRPKAVSPLRSAAADQSWQRMFSAMTEGNPFGTPIGKNLMPPADDNNAEKSAG